MKTMIFLIILSLFLVGCGVEFGQNYNHLQNQDITKVHEVDITGDTNRNIGDDGTSDEKENDDRGLYEYLNGNLCELHPECCGQYTDEQKNLRDLERAAVVEQKKYLCYQLPDEPFVISCGNDYEEDIILYSKERCLEAFQ